MTQFSRVLELLRERGADDIVVFGGGIIPDADIAELERVKFVMKGGKVIKNEIAGGGTVTSSSSLR